MGSGEWNRRTTRILNWGECRSDVNLKPPGMVANSLSSNGRLDGGKEEKRNPPKAAATAVDEEASYIRIHRCHLKDPRLGFANLETERANGEVEVE